MSAISDYQQVKNAVEQMRRAPAGHPFTVKIVRLNRSEESNSSFSFTVKESDSDDFTAINTLIDNALARFHTEAKREARSVLED